MMTRPVKISLFVLVSFISSLGLVFSEEQTQASPSISEEEEKLPKLLVVPTLFSEYVSKEEAEAARPYRELRIDTERAGFDRYYVQAEGFKVTDFFGIAGSYEIFDEAKKVQDMILTAGLVFPNFEGATDELLRPFVRPVFTKNIIAQGVIHHKNYPRFRYTFTNKDFILQFDKKDLFNWEMHNFDLLHNFKLFDRDDFFTLNPVYERRYIEKKNNDHSKSVEDIYLVQYSIHPTDLFEFFGQVNWSRSDSKTTDEKNRGFFFRLEPRLLFRDWKLRVTPGWFRGRSLFEPGDDEVIKNEIYLDIGKDFTNRLRGGLRLEYVLAEDDRSANPDIDVDVFNFQNKLTYEVLPGWDISLGAVYGDDLSDLDQFDYYGFFAETEYVRYGLFRGTAAIQWNNYFDLDKDEILLTLKVHAFRF